MHVTAPVERGLQRRVLEERAVGDRAVDPLQVLVEHAARADRQMAYLRVPHLAGRQAHRLTRGLDRRVRALGPEPVEDRRVRELDGVPRPGRRAAPAVEDDEGYRAGGDPAKRRERFHVEGGAADEGAVDTLLREQLLGVLGLDRAAVEHRHVEQALDECVRLARLLGCRGLAGADRPDRLVGDHQALVLADCVLDRLDLDAQHELHLAGLTLLERLPHARDHP